MKLVTTEAVMTALCQHCDSHIEMCEECGMREIIEGVPSAWIKCSERLPEPNEHVLVCCDLNGYCISGSYMCVAFRTDDMTTPCDYDDDIDSVYDDETEEVEG